MPARGTATNRQLATNRGLASGRGTASGRVNVDGSGGGGGGTDNMIFIQEQVVGGGGAASVTLTPSGGPYRQLSIFYVCRCDNGTAQSLRLQFNGDTAANYDMNLLFAQAGGASAAASVGQTSVRGGEITPSGAAAGAMAGGTIWIPYYATILQAKSITGTNFFNSDNTANNQVTAVEGGVWRTSNAAITSILIFPSAGNFVANSSFSLYGIT